MRPAKPKDDGRRAKRSPKSEPNEHNTSSGLVYGLIPVLEALRAGQRRIEQITVAVGARDERIRELMELARQQGVPVYRRPRVDLDRVVSSAKHQGIMARIAAVRYREPDELLDLLQEKVSSGQAPLVLGLDGIEDPRNMGAILRTAECAGVDAVFVPERRSVGLSETVAKTAAGALEYVPVARVTNLVRLIEQLKERNIWVVGAAAESTMQYPDWDWQVPVAIFLGAEGTGLHRLVREHCDALVAIPMAGKVESLNVSVAAGILLFEALRQRRSSTNQKVLHAS